MNNSFFAIEHVNLTYEEEQRPTSEALRKRESELVKIIEALELIAQSAEWSSLKQLIFDDLKENFEKRLLIEAKKDNPDPLKLAKLSGELKWTERYADLHKLAQSFKVELSSIKQQLYGKTQKESR